MRKYGNYPSVTTVTGLYTAQNRFLQQWLSKPENRKIAEESTGFGVKVHGYIESFFKGTLVISDGFENKPILNFFTEIFLPICTVYKDIGIIFCEKKIISDNLMIGGTLDLFTKDGYIIDFKTSAKQKENLGLESYKMQLAAYGAIIKDVYPQYKIRGARLVIGVRSTNKLQIVDITKDDMLLYFHKFMHYREEFYNLHGF